MPRSDPLDFISRVAVLVPKQQVTVTRFNEIFALNSRYWGRLTRAKRDRGGQHCTTEDPQDPTPAERRASTS